MQIKILITKNLSKVALFFLLVFLQQTSFALSSAKVDRDTISINQEVLLNINTDQVSRLSSRDMQALQKDFQITNRYSSYSFSMVNGRFKKSNEIGLYLRPKATGIFQIPSLQLGNDTTPAIEITVTQNAGNAAVGSNGSTLESFIETGFDKNNVYVQEQVLLSYRFYSPYTILESKTSKLAIENTNSYFLDKLEYTKEVNGSQYYVHEYRFALFPQRSGEINIPATKIAAVINTPGRNNSGFYQLNFGEKITLSSPEAMLSVKAIPNNLKHSWLPAKHVNISEDWSQNLSDVRVGDTLTRYIDINLEGVLPEHLPDLQFDDIPNLKIYPDSADKIQGTSSDGVTTQYSQTINVIATEAGQYTLPAIAIHWWDSEQDALVSSTLPEQKINVLDAQGNSVNRQFTTPNAPALTPDAPTNNTTQPSATENTADDGGTSFAWLKWLFILAGMSLFAVLAGFIYTQNKKKMIGQSKQSAETLLENAFANIEQANAEQDYSGIQQALRDWAQLQWPNADILSISDIEDHVQEQFKNVVGEEIQQLQKKMYSAAQIDSSWNASLLIQTLKANTESNINETQASAKNKLPDLYLS